MKKEKGKTEEKVTKYASHTVIVEAMGWMALRLVIPVVHVIMSAPAGAHNATLRAKLRLFQQSIALRKGKILSRSKIIFIKKNAEDFKWRTFSP